MGGVKTRRNDAAQASIDVRTRILNIWHLFILAILLPIWMQQRLLFAHSGSKRTVFSTSARQPFSEIVWGIFFPKRSKWLPERDMPDQSGRIAIVTGGASGIGFETTLALMRAGARVYVAARSHRRTADGLERLRRLGERWPGEVKLLACDLSDMDSVQSAVDEFNRQESQLHILICNAGVSNPTPGQRTAQGYDLTLGTNVLGHHQIVRALLPVLGKTKGSRVCIVSSACHNMHHPAGFDAEDPEWRAGVTMSIVPGSQFTIHPQGPAQEFVKYGHSKFLNVCQAKKYHRTYGQTNNIVFTSCDPGINATELLRNRDRLTDLFWRFVAVPFVLFHPRFGAITPLWACTASETAILGGQYLAPWARIASPAPPTENHDTQDRLFDWCEAQLDRNGY